MRNGILRGAGRVELALAFWLLAGFIPNDARGEPRFGDSTWVAPSASTQENPEAAGPRVARPDHERTWEKALRTPFRVAFFPVRVVARGLEGAAGVAEHFVPPGKHLRQPASAGISIGPAVSFSGSGGPAIGPSITYRNPFGPGSRASLLATWSMKDSRRARLRALVGETAPIGFGAEGLYDYRPNRRFYGIGNDSDDRRTIYLRRDGVADAFVSLGRSPLARARVSVGLSDMDVGRGYSDGPRAIDVFDATQVPFLGRDSRTWWVGMGGDLAALDDPINPSFGFHVRPELRRYRSSDDTDLHYDDFRLESRGYLPVFAPYRVLAVRLIYEGVTPRGGSVPIPFYRYPLSMDENRFSAYPPGRFTDRKLAVGHVEYRWWLVSRVWAVALAQWGEVASTNSRFKLNKAHGSYGAGLRGHVGGTNTARFEVAKGDEGITASLYMKGDF